MEGATPGMQHLAFSLSSGKSNRYFAVSLRGPGWVGGRDQIHALKIIG